MAKISHERLIRAISQKNEYTIPELANMLDVHSTTLYKKNRNEEQEATLTKYVEGVPEGGVWVFTSGEGEGTRKDPFKVSLVYTDPDGRPYKDVSLEELESTLSDTYEGFGDFSELLNMINEVRSEPLKKREELKDLVKEALERDAFAEASELIEDIRDVGTHPTDVHLIQIGRIVCENFDVLTSVKTWLEERPETTISIQSLPENEDEEVLKEDEEVTTYEQSDVTEDKDGSEDTFEFLLSAVHHDSRTLLVTNKADAKLPREMMDLLKSAHVMRIQDRNTERDQTRVNRCVSEIHRGIFEYILVDPDVDSIYKSWIESAASKSKKDVTLIDDTPWEV